MSERLAAERAKVCALEGDPNFVELVQGKNLNAEVAGLMEQEFRGMVVPGDAQNAKARQLKSGTSVYLKDVPEGVIEHARFDFEENLLSLNATFNCGEKQVRFHSPNIGGQNGAEVYSRHPMIKISDSR
jgi:hypothetical protein